MGCKIVSKGQSFPAEVHNRILTVHIGNSTIQKEVPFIRDEYPLDDISYSNERIAMYLNNGKYISVVRWDGTFTKYLADGTVCGFANIGEFDVRGDIQIMRRCAVVDSENDLLYEVWIYLIADDNTIIFDPANRAGYFVMDIQKNTQFIKDLYKATYFAPVFRLIEGSYCKVDKTLNGKILYELEGEFVTPSKNIFLL